MEKIEGRDFPEKGDSRDGKDAKTRLEATRGANTRDFYVRNIMNMNQRDPLFIDPKRWPPGKVLRWITISLRNEPDTSREGYMLNLGWEPVPSTMYPEFMMHAKNKGEAFSNCIVVKGSLLCQRDKELDELEMKGIYEQMAEERRSLRGLQGFNEPTMPGRVFQDKTVTGFGNPFDA